MSDSYLDQTSSEKALRLFCEAWSKHLVGALSAVLGEQVELRQNDGAAATSLSSWFHQAFPPLGGSLSVGLDREALVCIGAKFLKAEAADEEAPARAAQSFAEMLGHAAAGMASQLSAIQKSEVRAEALSHADQPPQAAKLASQLLLVTGFGSYPVSVVVTGSDLLLPFEPDPAYPPANSAPTKALAASTTLEPSAVNTRNLDLLLDVELPISVSFGRAQLPLKDVIKLTTGSIVELNRSVSEPVDIIVNNCTIARGEVVVVEGNFGVRIKQIVSKQERLRSVT